MLVATLWERWRTAELVAVAAGGRHAAMPDRRPVRHGPGRRLGVAVDSGHRLRRLLDRRLGTGVSGRRVPALRAGPFAPGRGDVAHRRAAGRASVLLATMVLPVLAITVVAAMLQIGGAAPGGTRCQDILRDPRADAVVSRAAGAGDRGPGRPCVARALVGLRLFRGPGAGDGRRTGLCPAHHLGQAALRRDIRRHADPTLCHHGRRLGHRVAHRTETARRMARSPHRQAGVSCEGRPGSRGSCASKSAWPSSPTSWCWASHCSSSLSCRFDWQTWSVAAGRPLGWIALVLPLAALQLRGRLRPHAVGLSGMAVLGLLACTIRGLQPCLALGHRPHLGLSHADARLGRLCLAGRGGHLVGRVVANHGRCRGTAARPDPHGRRLGPRGGHPGGDAGTESGIPGTKGNSFGRLPPSRWPAAPGPRWPSGDAAKDGPSPRPWA